MAGFMDSVFTAKEVCVPPPVNEKAKRNALNVIDIVESGSDSCGERGGEGEEEDEGTPLRAIFCLKKKSDLKVFEEKEDCFILDFDPFDEDPVSNQKLSATKNHAFNRDSPDIFIIKEKGKVACRDYPHSRHLCAGHPFEETSHESYCELVSKFWMKPARKCYCFVCDVAAPCKNWSGSAGHCHAIDNEGWKQLRKAMRRTARN